ncbi:hypothetical protein I4U23_009103 [Adineta vaga]|nr:hypothetical protein I4U23_009103 [Adineta vaga]
MDTLCEQIDKLTVSYLEEFGHLLSCKQLLEDTIKQGYFNLSRARIIMGVNNLSRLQYSERDPMLAATKIAISSSSLPFEADKETDKEQGDDALKWFGLLTPNMNEPKRIQIVRPHQTVDEFAYQNQHDNTRNNRSQQLLFNEQFYLNQQDYYKIGWKRLNAVQSLSFQENWPIVAGNAVASFSSGFLGGTISSRMAQNLALNVSLSVRPTSAACFFAVTVAHLATYYYGVLRPMFSDDPTLCPTCLEIRTFAIGSFIPVTLGTSMAVFANLSSCLLNKTIRLPQFNIRAYPEWREFFRRHAFKGMAHRYFVAYPLINGFLASMVFLGQNYYWRSYLRQHLYSIDDQTVPYKESKKRSKVFGPIQDFFTKAFSSKVRYTITLLLVAIAGGVIAVSLQPLVLLFYSNIGVQITPLFNQQTPYVAPIEQTTTVSPLPTTTTAVPEIIIEELKTTLTTTVKATTVKNDPTVDEEPIYLKDEPLTIKVPESTTVKPPVTEKPKESKPKTQKKSEKSEEGSERVKLEKASQQPEIIDVTGRNKEIPDAVKNFKSTKINMIKTKKLWIPIPKSNGGHRRVPPIAVRAGKEHTSSVKHWLFEEFLSHDECINLIKVHKEHVKKMKEIDPIICFNSIQTLRKHLKDLKPDTDIHVTPNDFTKGEMLAFSHSIAMIFSLYLGTTCINETFSSMLKEWGLKWSYSTAFYLGESPFSTLLSQRIEDGTGLQSSHGGKFQITSTDKGVGYKAHHDCTVNGSKQDRYATFLAYLNTVMEGGETEFPELEIKIKPKEGRVIVWNNMNEKGECEETSLHSANIVGDEEGKFVLQRWYYYENFYSLGKRPPEPDLPERKSGQAQVSCDEYDMGSCRAYDEWNYQHILKYRNVNHNLI